MIVVQDDFVADPAEVVSSRSAHPHGLRTITTIANGWDCLKVEGDVLAIDIPSLSAAANHAFVKYPVKLVVDLTGVIACHEEGIRWLRGIADRIDRGNGEFLVGVVPGGPLHQLLESEDIATIEPTQLALLRDNDPNLQRR